MLHRSMQPQTITKTNTSAIKAPPTRAYIPKTQFMQYKAFAQKQKLNSHVVWDAIHAGKLPAREQDGEIFVDLRFFAKEGSSQKKLPKAPQTSVHAQSHHKNSAHAHSKDSSPKDSPERLVVGASYKDTTDVAPTPAQELAPHHTHSSNEELKKIFQEALLELERQRLLKPQENLPVSALTESYMQNIKAMTQDILAAKDELIALKQESLTHLKEEMTKLKQELATNKQHLQNKAQELEDLHVLNQALSKSLSSSSA